MWGLNLNDSISNIRGQITSFATGVLNDSHDDDTDAHSISDEILGELRGRISNQEQEIQSLREENSRLRERTSSFENGNAVDNDDGWSWGHRTEIKKSLEDEKLVADLRRRIVELENEKKELTLGLDQLDTDCQETTDRLVAIKDQLQTENTKLKHEQDELRQKNEFLLKINEENQKRIAQQSNVDECDRLKSSLEEYETKVLSCEKELDTLRGVNRDLEVQCQEETKQIREENVVLLAEIEELKKSYLEVKRLEDTCKGSDNKDEVVKKLQLEIDELKQYCKNAEETTHPSNKEVQVLNVEVERLRNISNFAQIQLADKEDMIAKLEKQLREEHETSKQRLDDMQMQISEKEKSMSALEEKLKVLRENEKEFEATSAKLLILQKDVTDKNVSVQNLESINKKLLDNIDSLKLEIETKLNLINNKDGLVNQLQQEIYDLKKYEANIKQMEEKSKVASLREKDDKIEILNAIDSLQRFLTKSFESADYQSILNAISDILTHHKETCSKLEEKIKSLTVEKNNILLEKNMELERLIVNSEALSKDLLNKTEDLKHYKTECEELVRNNDMLINRLDEVNDTSGNLQTISESNEENVLHLESQLDEANKRIEFLEHFIAGVETKKANEAQNELQYVKTQLDVTESELDLTKEQYQHLKCDYEKLEGDNVNLQQNLDTMKSSYAEMEEDMNSTVDQIKTEYENTEYKNAEQNITIETLKEDIDMLLKQIEEFKTENKRLKGLNQDFEGQNELSQKEIEDLKEELATEIETTEEQRLALEKVNDAEMRSINEDNVILKNQLSVLEEQVTSKEALILKLQASLESLQEDNRKLQVAFDNFKTSVAENNNDSIKSLEAQVNELVAARNQMIQLIQEKHAENVNYHAEIQKLQQFLAAETEKCRTYEMQLENFVSHEEVAKKDEQIEKLADQNNFLREKCSVLAENLLQEQSNAQKILQEKASVGDREMALQKKLDGLRQHLIDVEEAHTKEVQQAEQRCDAMQSKLQEVEQREKNSSNRYTSVNIRANQQVESLQAQLQLITNQRDELKKKVCDNEDVLAKQTTALSNLQNVLKMFQRDKGTDIYNETERIRKQVTTEKMVQETMQKEIGELKQQLEESKQGLKAAVRLSDQVEASKKQVNAMKDEVTKLQGDLAKSEEKYAKLSGQGDGKVDKLLVKNLVIGLVSANNNLNKDQNQILKIISTVLDFNQQDSEKVRLDSKTQQHSSWFNSLLHPSIGQNMSQESLSLAFVRFLEAESKPRVLPSLLESSSAAGPSDSPDAKQARNVRRSPLLLNEVVLPTFADFGQSRNSSSILKDVLKDNSNS